MKNSFDEIWERIRRETNLKTLADLGEVIDKKQQTISYSKSKNEFSPAWAYAVGKKYGLLTEWIMTGEGPKRINEKRGNKKFDILDDAEEWLAEQVRINPDRKAWLELHFLDSFPGLREWREKRDAALTEGTNFKKQVNGGGWK